MVTGTVDTAARARLVSRSTYALSILTLIYGVSQLDRQVISLLLEGIKKDMHVSDTVLGLVSGFGFATLYVVSGVFMSRWADKGPRLWIISGGLAFYSVMTALAGFSQNIVHLALSRVGVSIGESTGLAPSTAFLSDYFPEEKRARAMAIFAGGAYIATFFGYPVIGWINQHYGWRPAFMAAGVPGIVLALLLRLTVADPPRGGSEKVAVDTAIASVGDTLRFISGQKSVWLAYLGAGFGGWFLFCFAIWTPSFLARVHHLSPVQIGLFTGMLHGAFGLLGATSGGFFADWIGKRDTRLRLTVPALISLLILPSGLVFLFAENLAVMFTAQAIVSFLAVFPMGATWAVMQSSVKPRMRALNASILLIFSTFIGLGFGPMVTGMLNDHLAPTLGPEAIRYSLTLSVGFFVMSAILLALSGLYSARDMARAQQAD
jgi:MFS family permease